MAIKEFRMRGSAAQVEMSGDVNLANETQNLRVRVVPSLGDSGLYGAGLPQSAAGISCRAGVSAS